MRAHVLRTFAWARRAFARLCPPYAHPLYPRGNTELAMSDMRLIVAGAGGRMGRTLVKAIGETPGLALVGATEGEGSPHVGQDSGVLAGLPPNRVLDRKSTRLNSSLGYISYAVFCLKKKKHNTQDQTPRHMYSNVRYTSSQTKNS